MSEEPKLTVDEKIDKLMEAILFLQQLNIMSLKAMDKILGTKESKIIKAL